MSLVRSGASAIDLYLRWAAPIAGAMDVMTRQLRSAWLHAVKRASRTRTSAEA